ncbi:hypothetical protein LJC15_05795 [Desulfovibrio sp. OttesenSCG-928-G11]|nr:hypothetical protein [Desulfovibrio sp. OttesenSCG-928-G11]
MPQNIVKPLDREGYLNRAVIKQIPLPDGSVVCIRALPASLIVSGAEDATKTFESANMLVQSLCDENGKPLFTEGEKDQAMTIDHMALKVILKEILDLNGLRPPKEGEEGAPEKN